MSKEIEKMLHETNKALEKCFPTTPQGVASAEMRQQRPDWWPESDWPPQLSNEVAENAANLSCDNCGKPCDSEFLFVIVFNGEKYFCSQECSDSCLDNDE